MNGKQLHYMQEFPSDISRNILIDTINFEPFYYRWVIERCVKPNSGGVELSSGMMRESITILFLFE